MTKYEKLIQNDKSMKSWFKTTKYEKLIQNDKVWKVNSKRQSMKS